MVEFVRAGRQRLEVRPVDGELGRATLRVTASEATVDDCCSVEGVTSIELERSDVRAADDVVRS